MKKQGITIVALIIAIIGLSVGFAAFASTLTIKSSADIHPDAGNFLVQFSKYSDRDATGSENLINPTTETSEYGDAGLIPTSDKKVLQDLHAKFTEPGQSVTYELFVRNAGLYVAYLKELKFEDAEHATGEETYKHCYASTTREVNGEIVNLTDEEKATPTLVSKACEGISISVTIGTAKNLTYSTQPISLGNQALASNGGYVNASVTISYTGNDFVDGPMEVEFGDIKFIASSNPSESSIQPIDPVEPILERGIYYVTTEVDENTGEKYGVLTSYDREYAEANLDDPRNIEIPSSYNVTKVDFNFNQEECTKSDYSDDCEYFSNVFSSAEQSSEIVLDDDDISYFKSLNLIKPVYYKTNEIVEIRKIGKKFLAGYNLNSVSIPDSVTTIDKGAFHRISLTNIKIGSGIKTIEKDAFYDDYTLNKVVIDASKEDDIYFYEGAFQFLFSKNANCTLTDSANWKTNTCLCWLKDDPTCDE